MCTLKTQISHAWTVFFKAQHCTHPPQRKKCHSSVIIFNDKHETSAWKVHELYQSSWTPSLNSNQLVLAVSPGPFDLWKTLQATILTTYGSNDFEVGSDWFSEVVWKYSMWSTCSGILSKTSSTECTAPRFLASCTFSCANDVKPKSHLFQDIHNTWEAKPCLGSTRCDDNKLKRKHVSIQEPLVNNYLY